VKAGIAVGVAGAVLSFAQTPAAKDPVKELFEGVCSGCHTLERVKAQHRSKEEWRVSTRAMIDQGAVLTPEETNMLLDYLVKNFGPEDGQ
jgi:mono/diheme cytochrome c family protein